MWQQFFAPASMLVSRMGYFSAFKEEAEVLYSPETSVDFQPIIRHHIPEDSRSLQKIRCKNLESFFGLYCRFVCCTVVVILLPGKTHLQFEINLNPI
jgi:hypothetical protein